MRLIEQDGEDDDFALAELLHRARLTEDDPFYLIFIYIYEIQKSVTTSLQETEELRFIISAIRDEIKGSQKQLIEEGKKSSEVVNNASKRVANTLLKIQNETFMDEGGNQNSHTAKICVLSASISAVISIAMYLFLSNFSSIMEYKDSYSSITNQSGNVIKLAP